MISLPSAFVLSEKPHSLWMQGYFTSKNNCCCTLVTKLDIPKAACMCGSIYNTYENKEENKLKSELGVLLFTYPLWTLSLSHCNLISAFLNSFSTKPDFSLILKK